MTNRFLVMAAAFTTLLAAQQPRPKDQVEHGLYNSVLQTQNHPNKQLQILNTWKEKYPDSGFKLIRAFSPATTWP